MHASRFHTNRKTLAIALLAGSSLLAVTPASAQDKEPDDGAIIVTAQKREQNLQDVPASVTALGTKKLEDLQVNELADLVKFLPSVTIQTSSPGFSQVYFRGVSSGENANHSTSLPTVGTYLDEMPITTIQGALDIHAYDLARVEALAGPQGTLYGASSMAGTIKMVTNKPDMGSTYGAVDLELNQVQHGAMGGIAEGFLNLRLSDMAAARLVAWYRHDGGYIDNIPGCRTYPSSGIEQCNDAYAKKDYNDADTYGARLALGIDLDDSWTLRPTVMGQVQKVHGTFAQERSSAVTKDYQTVQYNYEYSHDNWVQAALTIEGKIGNWDLVATGGHLWRDDETFQDYSDYAFFYDSYYHSLDPTSGYLVYDNDGNQISPNQYIIGSDRYRKMFGELRVSSPADSPIRFIGGVFGQRQTHFITQHYIIDDLADDTEVPGTVDNIWLTAQKRVDRDLAAFGELSYDLTDKLTVTAGGRVYWYKNSLEGFFGFNNPGFSGNPQYLCQGPSTVDGAPCNNLDKDTSDTGFIHKLNATYKITPDVLVYATWSRGFRPGGINRRGSLAPYGPDTLDNYEIGWKTQFGPVTFNGAIFQEDWNHIQLSFLGANGLTEVRDAGIARIRGIEGDLTYHQGGLTLSASGSYNDAKITKDFCPVANPDFDCSPDIPLAPAGTQLPVTPKIKGTALARYEFPLGDSMKAHIQFAVSHTGKRRNDLRTLINPILGNLPAYTTADASFGIDFGDYRAELFATNLFGSKGVINSSTQCAETICGDVGDFAPGGGVFYDTLIKPRVVGVKVGANF
ncbi:MAG: TonB-dependent receptor [Candidatus Andeanibacterium colombiense]|uniref:TonB-dependent receptor n=1 Tax=Candidatus Andeanibacterium colombiense TaxID=3121345 RepID=A0AAJ6BNV1_9SPHN|nr:MAG: TonB-dependent receptor [Sphingomonadaceae bacterium]